MARDESERPREPLSFKRVSRGLKPTLRWVRTDAHTPLPTEKSLKGPSKRYGIQVSDSTLAYTSTHSPSIFLAGSSVGFINSSSTMRSSIAALPSRVSCCPRLEAAASPGGREAFVARSRIHEFVAFRFHSSRKSTEDGARLKRTELRQTNGKTSVYSGLALKGDLVSNTLNG